MQRKLARAALSLVDDAAEGDWVERHLRRLVGLGSGEAPADQRDSEAFAAWRRFFEALADWRPAVIVFEDLHWVDDALLDFVDDLVERIADVPLLIVATTRPELLDRRPGWGGGKANATTLSLAELSDDETAGLSGADRRARCSGRPAANLLARAGGNPLYAEQYVQMLEERGEASSCRCRRRCRD